MRNRGRGGRFAKEMKEEPAELGTGSGKEPPMTASRLRHCRKLVVYKVAEAMPSVVDGLVVESRKGSFEHTKEILKLAHASREKVVVEAPAKGRSGYVRDLLAKIQQAGEVGAKPDAPCVTLQ